ncbi:MULTISPECIES: RNA 2',3'-cyclic phosphodiesterase [Lysinibacillus]|uniref:RNA 2',3'-cyclic phosphodiesterase n=1 Tax=Lysinibacillus TaxID=400634 RepID=UPI00257D4D07|nr:MULTISPECIES: RNA 2',3'-cyclic phosphodiesterase [Lysinibacillus]
MNRHFFIAVPLPLSIKTTLKEKCEMLKTNLHFKRWVHLEDYHITLAFLGNADLEQLQIVLGEIKESLRKLPSFELKIRGLDIFGRKEYPRILWASIFESQPLNNVRDIVYKECVKAGFDLDNKPFVPHITVARKWNETHGKMPIDLVMTEELELPKFLVEEVVLYETKFEEIPKYHRKAVIHLDDLSTQK